MNTEQRLTTPELVEELRSSLDATNGWIPAFSGPEGPVGLPKNAGLAEVASALQEFAAAAVPAPVARHLERAAESAASALAGGDDSTYGHLGVAYAHVLQAQRAASKEKP
ncbi:hypothetical protein ACIBBE_43470 [Streptomyces sp. NPDC051644]|uniref:hypothetical protein n=1 Tax=Streptomyces sp. NPDC051644 TaxID=3365666 RepID=UPI0037B78A25